MNSSNAPEHKALHKNSLKMNYFLFPSLNKHKDMHIWHYTLSALSQVIT